MKKLLRIFLKLTRFNISIFSALAAFMGYVLYKEKLSIEMLIPVSAVFLIASGASALNQFQEKKADAIMERTRLRPIPSGEISPLYALVLSIILIVSGILILGIFSNSTAAFLALLAVVWYNGLYTYLKQITPFAVIPGALIGSIPPFIGWSAAGGNILNPQILAVALFFFIWQVPHFWLLILNYGKDYEKAGFPSLSQVFTDEQLKRITFIWITATAVTPLVLPLFLTTRSSVINLFLAVSSLWLIINAGMLFRSKNGSNVFNRIFQKINIYALLIIFLLSAGSY